MMMMKRLFLTCGLFTTTLISFGQSLTTEDIVGNWKVNKIINSPHDLQFQALSDSFKNATFSFYQTKKFQISTTFSTPIFKVFTEKSNNSNWIFDKNSQHIKIGCEQNKYAIMRIVIKQQNNQVLFQLDSTELIMEMTKQ